MNNFKKYLPYFPHFLLSITVFASMIRGFSIADAIAIFALCCVSGFRSFLDTKMQPNYYAEFKIEIDALRQEVTTLKTEVGQISFSSKRVVNEKIRF